MYTILVVFCVLTGFNNCSFEAGITSQQVGKYETLDACGKVSDYINRQYVGGKSGLYAEARCIPL